MGNELIKDLAGFRQILQLAFVWRCLGPTELNLPFLAVVDSRLKLVRVKIQSTRKLKCCTNAFYKIVFLSIRVSVFDFTQHTSIS